MGERGWSGRKDGPTEVPDTSESRENPLGVGRVGPVRGPKDGGERPQILRTPVLGIDGEVRT